MLGRADPGASSDGHTGAFWPRCAEHEHPPA